MASGAQASGSEDPLFTKHFNQQNSIAVHGYDVVSYFDGTPLQGSSHFEVDYNDIVFQFANQKNADTFSDNPQRFIPAYGGWCATAMGMMNKKVDITPTSFLVQDGVLYLFSSSMGPARDEWVKNQPDLKSKADANWAKISSY